MFTDHMSKTLKMVPPEPTNGDYVTWLRALCTCLALIFLVVLGIVASACIFTVVLFVLFFGVYSYTALLLIAYGIGVLITAIFAWRTYTTTEEDSK